MSANENELRAERVNKTLDHYAREHLGQEPDEETISDFLTDLMHYCDQRRLSPRDEFEWAMNNYQAEKRDAS